VLKLLIVVAGLHAQPVVDDGSCPIPHESWSAQVAHMKMEGKSAAEIKLLTDAAEKSAFTVPGSNMTENLWNLRCLADLFAAHGH
jgi:hypothetical protein